MISPLSHRLLWSGSSTGEYGLFCMAGSLDIICSVPIIRRK